MVYLLYYKSKDAAEGATLPRRKLSFTLRRRFLMRNPLYPPKAPLPDGSTVDMEFIPKTGNSSRGITADDIFNRLADLSGDKVDQELKETIDFVFRRS
jgi:hypothetical protein